MSPLPSWSRRRLPFWATRGLAAGLMTALPVPVAVLLVALLPDLKLGYPLVLLPLLVTGPLAVRELGGVRAVWSALLAGTISGLLVAGSLAIGSQIVGTSVWTLTSAAAAPPMPTLPRLAVLPMPIMTWAQQDVLFFQPILALALGLLVVLVRGAFQRLSWVLPRSVRARLMLALGGSIAMIYLVGLIGFSALEDMHYRGHRVQLQADWQRHLSQARTELDAAQRLRANEEARVAHVDAALAIYAHLTEAAPHPGISGSVDTLRGVLATYRPVLDAAFGAVRAYRSEPGDEQALRDAFTALDALRDQVDADAQALVATDDLAHHQRLIVLMLVVGVAGALGLWFGHRTVAAIDVPIRDLIDHLLRVAHGDFSRRAPAGGPSELVRLANAVDSMARDLDRLYAVERAGRAAAEAMVAREQILSGAGAALVAASDRESIYQVAVESAVALAEDAIHVRATFAIGPVGEMVVKAAHGSGAAEALGARVDAQPFANGQYAELQQRRFEPGELDPETLASAFGFPPRHGSIIVTPLTVRSDLSAMIVVEADERLAGECGDGLATLGAEVTLALESAALMEDLLVRRSEARFRSLVQNSSDVVMIVGADGVIQYQSPSGERVFGYGHAELVGSSLRDVIHPDDVPQVCTFLADVGRGSSVPARVEWRVRHRDGSWIDTETVGTNLLDDPDVCGMVLNSRDIGDRRVLQEQLTYQAFHDPLTGLPNRALFMDRLERALVRADRREQNVAVLFLDLDNFKVVNDSLGHQVGDQLLVAVAERLQRCVRTEDTVARLGGDEFTILIEDVQDLSDTLAVAERIADQLRTPFTLGGHEVFSTSSVGIAVSASGGGSCDHLLRDADLAMYRAKSDGKARYAVFDRGMNARAMERLELETDLRRAVDRAELRLVYQPIISLDTMRATKVEALVRWQHPERGTVSPVDFIPLAEETGLIVPIGQWVLAEACRQARAWQRQYPAEPPLLMSVNLSPRQFQHPALVDDIARILRESDLEPRWLELEITEHAVMEDADAARATLEKLRALGISLAIDDFGTGYSSLSYLKGFPVDTLKIDRSFIAPLDGEEEAATIVRAVAALGHALGLVVTAEGIETEEQMTRVRALGCDLGQGFIFSRPVPGDSMPLILAANRSRWWDRSGGSAALARPA